MKKSQKHKNSLFALIAFCVLVANLVVRIEKYEWIFWLPLLVGLLAGLQLFSFLIHEEQASTGTGKVDSIASDDGALNAQILAWGGDKSASRYRWARAEPNTQIYYEASVVRNAQDGVYQKSETFDSLRKARVWMTSTYNDELAKHEQQLAQEQPTETDIIFHLKSEQKNEAMR